MAPHGVPQKSPARNTRIISTLLCLLAFVAALLPCTAAMASTPAPTQMSMAPTATHCAACCETKPSTLLAPCCAKPSEPAQQITLSAYDLPHPIASAIPVTQAAISYTPHVALATLRTRPPLHPILRI